MLGDKASKSLENVFNADNLAENNDSFTTALDGFKTGLAEDDLPDNMYKDLVGNLKLDIYKQKAVKYGWKEDKLKSLGEDIAQIFAAVFAAKYIKINGGTKEEKENNTKKQQHKTQFIEAAKKFQSDLPAAKIAKVCDLPGRDDIKISTNTKMYDINGKETNKWTLEEEIDSDDEIQEWREFLNTGDGTDTPAHPEAIAAAIAQELAGLAEASNSTLAGVDAAAAAGGLALAASTGGLSLPATIGFSVVKGIMKKQHVRKGQKLLEDWYNRAMEIVNKYPQFTLAKLGKKDAKRGKDIKA